ncbi:MAG TPA: SurA N-terminal domain-containing protein [Gaiellaceae bacterium]|nr:SurA N-terminal domain-containing protein [Gaiellaceae bacterium]
MRRAGALSQALVVVLVAAACGGEHAGTVPPGAIARVGDRAIPRAAFDAELARSRRAYAARGQQFPKAGTAAYRRLRDSVVDLLVDRARLELAARRARVSVTPAQVDARLRALVRRSFGGDPQRFREQLRRTGTTEAEVRAAIRYELLAGALRGAPPPSPPDVTYAPGFEPTGGG